MSNTLSILFLFYLQHSVLQIDNQGFKDTNARDNSALLGVASLPANQSLKEDIVDSSDEESRTSNVRAFKSHKTKSTKHNSYAINNNKHRHNQSQKHKKSK